MRRTTNVAAKSGRRPARFLTSSPSRNFSLLLVAASALLSLLLTAALLYPESPFFYLPLRLALSSHRPRIYDPTCNSRAHHHTYSPNNYHRTPSPPPSPYLLAKLRDYENLHRRCGPISESIDPTLNPKEFRTDDCKFVVYTPSQGLGNRILGLSSTFLYALLTNRVLLVDFGPDMEDLFCEPFPNSTWYLPQNFPFRFRLQSYRFRRTYSYGNLLKKKEEEQKNKEKKGGKFSDEDSSAPALLQIFLQDKYNDYDKLFFRDENQGFVHRVPWLVMVHDGYFIPCLFQMQSFRSELEKLFPDQETVFHHLAKYLVSPSNQAWELITRFHDAYLAKAEERIGFQIRVFEPRKTPTPVVMKQILSCTRNHNILPQLPPPNVEVSGNKTSPTTSILVASLSHKYYEEIDSMYGRGRRHTGIAVYQASQEGKQHFGDHSHNMKAWMDIYLLSMSDVLVTSSMSTFGYVAAAIAGVKPWIVMIPDPYHPRGANEPACERAMNLEPCFHFPPWFAYPDQPGTVGPVGRCEDVSWGLKLIGGHKTRG